SGSSCQGPAWATARPARTRRTCSTSRPSTATSSAPPKPATTWQVSMSDRVLAQPALADLGQVQATSRWVTGGDLRLHVLDYGGDGVPLVMLPGITSPAITMDFVARRLTDLVRPIVVDVRGRGLSDDGDSYTLADYACD